MPLMKWDPFSELQEILDANHKRIGWDFAVDVYEENESVIAKMNVPGIDPDRFEITVEDDLLRVAGSRDKEEEVEDKEYYRKEIRCGSFERVINLPCAVMAEKTSASYENGVLKIVMPKKTPTVSKQIKVKISELPPPTKVEAS